MAITAVMSDATLSEPSTVADGTENLLREKLQSLLQNWRRSGLPPRLQLMNELRELLEWREKSRIAGLWASAPLMLTATIDDGWGHGLEVIEQCARLAGLRTERIGLLQGPAVIVDCCRRRRPLWLGLTVLQFDSEADVRRIAESLPATVEIIAGGAPFQIDPEFAERAGVRHVAGNVADFLQFLLSMEPPQVPC